MMKRIMKKKRWRLLIFIVLVGAAGFALFYVMPPKVAPNTQ